MNAGRLTHATE